MMSWNGIMLKGVTNMFCDLSKDGAAADQAVGGVKAHQTIDRYGP